MTPLLFDCQYRYAGGFELRARFEADCGVTAIFGPSGSGKTTILSLIAGLLKPDSGCIALDGRLLVNTHHRVWIPPQQRHIGLAFQDHLLFPHMSVKKNLLYGARKRSLEDRCWHRLLTVLDLSDLLDRYPTTLSGGEKQRVALGRAILQQPRLLMLDEPLTGLDTPLKHRVISYMERIIEEYDIPVLLISHDQEDVRRLCDHVVVLEEGRVMIGGPMPETLDRAILSKLKTSTTPLNVVRVTNIHQTGNHWEGEIGNCALYLPHWNAEWGSAGYIQFSPSDVSLSRRRIPDVSIRNQLAGRVCEVISRELFALVSIDVGQRIWSEVTPEAVSALDIHPGCEVHCLIKTSALRTTA